MKKPIFRKIFNILVYAFALTGFGIIGAWAFYQLGFTKNKGAVSENYRYLMSVDEMNDLKGDTLSQQQTDEMMMTQYARLAAFGRFYPQNAALIMKAAALSGDPRIVDKMLAAGSVYLENDEDCSRLMEQMEQAITHQSQQQNGNLIPWMDTPEWEALKQAITKDSALIIQAGKLSGVEPRLIAGCLIGEQIRLFNSKRETFKKYLGPVKVLSVQSQFSYGVNGIKDFTAAAVEEHLKDPSSEYYMGPRYEHLLDFETEDHATERYKRLVDYHNHLYSYIYTGCILHQTMLQWQRAGYDISHRPDVLFTLFNVGFSQSEPKADPRCGGSHINVAGRTYTFGEIGFDFYYSGELFDIFPFWSKPFIKGDGSMSEEEIAEIQSNMSTCRRPPKDSGAYVAPRVEPEDEEDEDYITDEELLLGIIF